MVWYLMMPSSLWFEIFFSHENSKSCCLTHWSLSLFLTWKIPHFHRVNNINISIEGSRFVTYLISKWILLQFKNHNITIKRARTIQYFKNKKKATKQISAVIIFPLRLCNLQQYGYYNWCRCISIFDKLPLHMEDILFEHLKQHILAAVLSQQAISECFWPWMSSESMSWVTNKLKFMLSAQVSFNSHWLSPKLTGK